MVEYNYKITTIGGGTGNSHILKELKNQFSDISAIVAMTDNGGNSGFLRDELGIVPPGDIRACICALSENENFANLLKYRFNKGSLDGTSMGNLMLAAITELENDFYTAVKKLSLMASTKGNVIPISVENINLVARLENGEVISGEKEIALAVKKYNRITDIHIDPKEAIPLEDATNRIEQSDILLIAPGSLYTSIIPNLIFSDVQNALKNTKAKVYYIMNIMTQSYETYNFRVIDHINEILKYSKYLNIDTVLVNNGFIPVSIVDKYKIEKSVPIKLSDFERDKILDLGINIVENDYVMIENEFIRHNVKVLIKDIIERYRYNNEK